MTRLPNSYRALIIGETNSPVRISHVASRKSRYRRMLRCPPLPTDPPPSAAGEFSFSATNGVVSVASTSRPYRERSGFACPGARAHQLNSPAAARRLNPALQCPVRVFARSDDAQGFGSAPPRVGGGGGYKKNRNPDWREQRF